MYKLEDIIKNITNDPIDIDRIREIRDISKELNTSDENPEKKLDCSEVAGLKNEVLEAIFSGIRKEWRDIRELDKFIVRGTLHPDLKWQIRQFLKKKSIIKSSNQENDSDKKEVQNVTENLEKEKKIQEKKSEARVVLNLQYFEFKTLLKKPSLLMGSGVIILLLIAGVIKLLPYFLKTKITHYELTIGTLWKPEAHQNLVEYIEDNTVPAGFIDYLKGQKIKVIINGDRTLNYSEAQSRIANKQWDIAFALSPINSIFAKEKNYSYIAGMFPGSTSYQSGFFVKQNSPIQNLSDINEQTTVALGGFNSASSFYMPIYDLYGKTINVNIGNRGQSIIELVKEGKVDVGAAAIGDSIRKDDPELRIIHVSREIPGSSVYLSPNLSPSDQENLKELFLKAPAEIQKEANYGNQPEPDYKHFTKIIERVEEMFICTDFTQNPVVLACPSEVITIKGKINGVSLDTNRKLLKVSGNNNQVYNVSLPLDIMQEIFGSDKLTDIQGKSVVIKTYQIGVNNQINIKRTTQLNVSEIPL